MPATRDITSSVHPKYNVKWRVVAHIRKLWLITKTLPEY